jgi:GNAT superfamily N-acetyltransferase
LALAVDSLVKVARENYAQMVPDLAPLLEAHWHELALFKDEIALAPDWEAYAKADELGNIRAYGVREDGQLIGYAVFQVLERHAHYAHRWAVNDILWIAPEHRNLGVGSALCEGFEWDLRWVGLTAGPIVIHIETKAHAPELAMLLKARGYGPVGMAFARRFA